MRGDFPYFSSKAEKRDEIVGRFWVDSRGSLRDVPRKGLGRCSLMLEEVKGSEVNLEASV